MGAIASQPAFIIVFGAIKLGKTTDALMSFPRARFIAAPGALKPSLGVAGFEPTDVRDVETIAEMVKIVSETKPGTADAIVVDDFSLYVDRQARSLQKSGVSGYDLWGAIFRIVLDLRETARRCGMHAVLTMHEIPPKMDNGIKLAGTVALPGKKLPYDVPASADMVLRATAAGTGFGNPIGWPVIYRCNPSDTEWRTGDRHNVVPDMSPMNLGEILRLFARETNLPATWAPRRAVGLEWHEPWVEKAAQTIMEGKGVADLARAREVLGQLETACLGRDSDLRHALWACRDAWDRAVLRTAIVQHRRKFFFRS